MQVARRPLLIFLGIVVLIATGVLIFKHLRATSPPASLWIETPHTTAEAFLDDQALGQTPLQKDDLAEGQRRLKLVSGEQVYQTEISLLRGTQTVVRREFGPAEAFSSGVVLYFERTGRAPSISITSDPDGARVRIDGKDVGKTPLLVDEITSGSHDLELSFENFESCRMLVRLADGYQLRFFSKLALNPLAKEELEKIDSGNEKVTVYDLSPKKDLFVDFSTLSRGIGYWIETRGLPEGKIDYFVDAEGGVYDSKGETFDPQAFDGEPVETITVGYLGRAGGEGLSDPARAALDLLAKKVLKTPPLVDKVRILPTGVGWLRVRAEPSLSATEITKVNVGEKFEALEEKTGWVKIKLPDGKEGWVSADYVEKFQEAP